MINTEKYSNIDSLQNILSNKISALFRYEPKDIVDIWINTISKEIITGSDNSLSKNNINITEAKPIIL